MLQHKLHVLVSLPINIMADLAPSLGISARGIIKMLCYPMQISMSALLASTTVTTTQIVPIPLGALHVCVTWVSLEMEQAAA